MALLFYGYATGVFSSRKLEKATYDSIAFRYICANTNPDHDTIASFRKRFLKELGALFVEILVVAEAMRLVKLGTISLDGTKIKANASKHKALSWDYANRLEVQLKQEVEELMRLAEEADQCSRPEEMAIPEELKRREERLVAIARAKEEIQARALADTGYFSEANVEKCTTASLVPFIPEKREKHNRTLLRDVSERTPNRLRMPRRCRPCDIACRPGKGKRFVPYANPPWKLSLALLSRCRGSGNFCYAV